jgi:hypothetical protein
MRRLLVLMSLVALALPLTARAAEQVTVNGVLVPKATSTVEVTQDLVEFREGGDPNPQVLPGAKRYGVCIATAAPVAILDAELPRADAATRMIVQIEDGRSFARCLVASLKTEGSGGKRRLTYCLRCEDVTTP